MILLQYVQHGGGNYYGLNDVTVTP